MELKLLSFNAGYFLGYDGTRSDYVRAPWKGLIGRQREAEKLEIGEFAKIVNEKGPDLVCLQEVDQGSMRTRTTGHVQYLEGELEERFNVEASVKYGGLAGKVPLFRRLSNGVLFKSGEASNHFLSTGQKNLVQEVKIGDMSVFSVHLARFSERMRKRQLKEIVEIAEEREKWAVVGDFNFHGLEEEIEEDQKMFDAEIVSAGDTFPSENAEKPLDNVMVTRRNEVKKIEVIDSQLSDHRPLLTVLEF